MICIREETSLFEILGEICPAYFVPKFVNQAEGDEVY
jgi:hypothetical protein